MGNPLTGHSIASTYKDVMQVSNGNQGIDATTRTVLDGEGTDSALQLSTLIVRVKPATNGQAFDICNVAGNVLFSVNTSTNIITAGSGVKFSGDGSLLTSVPSTGSGGTTSEVALTLQADSNSSGTAGEDIILKIGSKVVGRIPNTYAASLPTGVEGNYFIKTIADNWGNPKGGVILDGVDDYYSVADNDNLDFGTGDFSIVFDLSVVDNNLYEYIIAKGTTGARFMLAISPTANKTFYVDMSDGTNTVSGDKGSIDLKLGDYRFVGLIVSRTTGLAYIVLNGIIVDSFSISSITGSFTNTNNAIFFGSNSQFFAGIGRGIYIFNRALTQAEVTKYYNNGRPDLAELDYADIGASNTNLVTNGSFTGSATGWTLNGTAAYQAGSGDGEIIFTGDGTINNYIFQNTLAGKIGKKYKLKYEIIENSLVGTGATLYFSAGGSIIYSSATSPSTVGEHEIEFVCSSTSAPSQIQPRISASATSGTLVLDNISLIHIGCTAQYKDFGRLGAIETMNGLHATSAGSPKALAPEQRVKNYNDVKTLVTGNTTLTSAVPKNYMLKQIVVENTTANAYTLNVGSSTSGGTDVVNGASIAASGLTTITVNKVFSTSAAQTLYLQSAAWLSSSSTFFLIMEAL